MPTFLIMYDLNKEGAAYNAAGERLTTRIKALSGTWWHHLTTTWIIVSDMTAAQICDDLCNYMDVDDELLVVLSSGVGAWAGFNERGSNWLTEHL